MRVGRSPLPSGSWSSGYDVALTQRRSPVQIRPSPSDRDSARFGHLIAPAACLGDHRDLDRLNGLYALQLVRQPLPTSEQVAERPRPTHSTLFFRSSPPTRPARRRTSGCSGGVAGSANPTVTPKPEAGCEPRFICARCRSPIRRNPTLRISFCEVCGLTQGIIELRPGYRSPPLCHVHPFSVPRRTAPALRPVPSRPGSGPVVRPSRPPIPAPSAPVVKPPLRQSGAGNRPQPGLILCPRTRVPTRVHAERGV